MVVEFASTGLSVQEPENGQPYPVNITVIRTQGSVDVVTVQWSATLNGKRDCFFFKGTCRLCINPKFCFQKCKLCKNVFLKILFGEKSTCYVT